MRLNAPITEISTQPIALENCDDTFVDSKQIDALLEQDIRAYATCARIGGAIVRFTQLQNLSALDPTPLIIGNGFCGSEGAYKGLAVETALRGRNVTFVKPPRIQSPCGVINVKHLRDPLLVQEQALWLAGRTSMHRLDCDQFDEYGHSLGGVTTTAVALHKIGRIRKLILAGSAGIDGRHNLLSRAVVLPRVLRHDILEAIPDIHRQAGAKMAAETLVHVASRPLRTAREAVAVARTDIRPTLDILQDSGTQVGLIQFARDGFFSVEQVAAANQQRDFGDWKVILNALHVYPQQQPEDHSYDIDGMLYDLTSSSKTHAA